jgi:hypothetical protein
MRKTEAIHVRQAFLRGKRAARQAIVRWVTRQRKVSPDPENVFGLLLESMKRPGPHALLERHRAKRDGDVDTFTERRPLVVRDRRRRG